MQAKLERVLNEPFVSNEAAFEGAKPNAPFVKELGPVLRIAEWNINRTPRESQVKDALADKAAFLAKARVKRDSKMLQKITEELNLLQATDVVVLDEIDDRVARSNYENTPSELANALRMNYAFAVEFIELDNIYAADGNDRKTRRRAGLTRGLESIRDATEDSKARRYCRAMRFAMRVLFACHQSTIGTTKRSERAR